MRVRLLTFGMLRERLGGPEEMVELPEGATVGELIGILRGRTSNPTRSNRVDEGLWRSLAVAVNREYASQAAILCDGDEVALLPPVSGGCCAEGGWCAVGEMLASLGTARTAGDSLRECCVDGLRE
jgi:molybdopterin converting factor small subunit